MTIYIVNVFNLRGNCRLSGENRRKERENVFGEGTKTLVSITILVKKPNYADKAKIYYHDIGDYLTREEKLEIIKRFGSILNPEMVLSSITPNEAYDWVNKRSSCFHKLIPVASKYKYQADTQSVFRIKSRGLETSRDSIAYNFSIVELEGNIQRMIDKYNLKRELYHKDALAHQEDNFWKGFCQEIVWTRGTKKNIKKMLFINLNAKIAESHCIDLFLSKMYIFRGNVMNTLISGLCFSQHLKVKIW